MLQAISARDGVRFTFTSGDFVFYRKKVADTEASFKKALEDDAKAKSVESRMPVFFIHLNRSGTVAVATGSEPAVWPEDEA